MLIRFITTGGTIDKIYFDALSQFEVGESQVKHILTEGLVDFDYEVVPLLQKDSLEMTEADHTLIAVFLSFPIVGLFVPWLFAGLGLFVAFLQAFIFTFLTIIYIGSALEDDH